MLCSLGNCHGGNVFALLELVQSSEAEQAETVLRQQKDEMEEWAANRYVDADSCTRPCVCLILNPFFSRVAVPLLVTVERSSF